MSNGLLALVSGVPVRMSRYLKSECMETSRFDALPDGDLILWLSSSTPAQGLPPIHFLRYVRYLNRPEALDRRPEAVFLPGMAKAS